MKIKAFVNVTISFEDTEILELNQYQEPDKPPFIISADIQCIIETIGDCESNLESLSTTKVSIENKNDVYR